MEDPITYLFDISGALIVGGIIFWLAGGAKWVEQIVKKKELENEAKALDIAERKKALKETEE
jgi:hypothetical protein